MSIKGYPSQEKLSNARERYATVGPTGHYTHGVDTRPFSYQSIGSDAAEAGSTTQDIVATSHAAVLGDLVSWTSGNLDTQEFVVCQIVDANTIRLGGNMSEAPGVGDTFNILRPKMLQVSSGGGLTTAPIQFVLDGTDTEVTEDTGTPANNKPLPVKLIGLDGDVVIKSENLNLEVQLDHDSANPDSVQIGDGTDVLGINADGSINAVVADGGGSLTVDDGGGSLTVDATNLDIRDLSSSSDSVAAVQSGTWNITNVSGTVSLPTGAATETTVAAVQTATEAIQAAVEATLDVDALNFPDTVDTDSGASGASTIRTVLATRHEAATTPVSVRISDGSAFATPSPQGRSYGDSARNDYSSANVTTGAWVELIASTAADINQLHIFDSSGQTLELGVGAAASESRVLIIPPGGFGSAVDLRIASGSRVAIKAISATASTGEISLTGLN